MTNKKIAASLLSADFSKLDKEIALLTEAGIKILHLDVMDGVFVPNLTFGATLIKDIKKITNLKFDVHLMITKPENLLKDFIKAGADCISIHIESTDKIKYCLQMIKSANIKAGLSLKPATELSSIFPYLHLLDVVLVMTVEPGFGGQKFLKSQLQKIKDLKKHIIKNNLNIKIAVDGGINLETAQLCPEADIFIAGSFIFSKNYKDQIKSLQAVL